MVSILELELIGMMCSKNDRFTQCVCVIECLCECMCACVCVVIECLCRVDFDPVSSIRYRISGFFVHPYVESATVVTAPLTECLVFL